MNCLGSWDEASAAANRLPLLAVLAVFWGCVQAPKILLPLPSNRAAVACDLRAAEIVFAPHGRFAETVVRVASYVTDVAQASFPYHLHNGAGPQPSPQRVVIQAVAQVKQGLLGEVAGLPVEGRP